MFSLSVALGGCLGSGSNGSQSNKNNPTITAISLTPQNSAVTVGKTLQLSATAAMSDGSKKDITSTATWTTSDATIGTINSSGLVSGIKIGVLSVGVNSGQAKATTLLNVTTKNFSKASLNGVYTITLTSETTNPRFEAGSIKADGAGDFSGLEDINAAAGVQKAVPLSGTYEISADGRGTLALDTTGEPARTFHFVLSANSSSPTDNNAQVIQFDKSGTAVGQLQKQDSSAFNNALLASHTFVFRVGGLDSTKNPISQIGDLVLDTTGTTLTSGQLDENDNGTINGGAGSSNSVSITSGTIGAVDATTGRAILTLTVRGQAEDFAVYIVSGSKMELIGLDAAPMLLGEGEIQASPLPSSATAGGYVLVTEIGDTMGQYWIMGYVAIDGSGNIIGLGQSQDGGIGLNFAAGGTLVFSADGRGVLNENTSQGSRTFTAYIVSGTRIYVQQNDNPHAAAGVAELQQPGPDGFSGSTLNNSFVLVASDTSDGNIALVGPVVADGAGHLTGILDVSEPQPGNPSQITVSTVAFGGGYSTPSASGIATGGSNTQGTGVQNFALFLVSSNKALFQGLSPTDINGNLLLQ